jgi:hypothetical protein
VPSEPPATIGWAWFERDPSERLDEVEDALASIDQQQWEDAEEPGDHDAVPDEVWHRNPSWWNGNQATGT